MEWKDWSSVAFTERYRLPSSSGIYVVADANECVWYVGQAANIKSRWEGKTHHPSKCLMCVPFEVMRGKAENSHLLVDH